MGNNNDLLMGLALLERVEPQLKTEKREQLSKSTLNLMCQTLRHALNKITSAGISDIFITGYIIDAVDMIESLCDNPEFVETDTETKLIISQKITDSLENLYITTGKYYADRDFDYSIRMKPLLCRIVDKCILKGYYFGYSA